MSSDTKRLSRKLAVILHADVVGSTALVQNDERLAHQRIADAFRRLSAAATSFGGAAREVRGDALVAEFERASDAVCAALFFQASNRESNAELTDDIRPGVRIGVSLGEVVIADGMLTGSGVVLAQRLEQLAEPGGVCVSGAIHEALPGSMPFDQENLGEQELKGFGEPVRVYAVRPKAGTELPKPTDAPRATKASTTKWLTAAAAAAAIIGGGLLAWLQPWAPAVEPAPEAKMAFPLPDEPSIAVLPFSNISGDGGQDYFSDGITHDLITELSRVSGLFVIAANTVFTYKGAPIDVRRIGQELGVRYILEGSLQKAGERVRVNAKLVDAVEGHHLWAERYDRRLTDVLLLQDEVAQEIVSALAIRLTSEEERRMGRRVDVDPQAYDLLLRGLQRLNEFTRESNAEARTLFEKAVALDPGYARAYADVAITYFIDVAFGFGFIESPDETLRLGLSYAQKALSVDPSVPQAHFALAGIFLRMKRYEEAAAAARRATEVSPGYAAGYAQLGNVYSYSGRPEAGVEAIRKAMRLNPLYPGFYSWFLGHAYFVMGDYETAAEFCIRALERNPHFPGARVTLAAAYGILGRVEEAEWEAQEILNQQPDFTVELVRKTEYFQRASDLERYLEGLRKAGIPENMTSSPLRAPPTCTSPAAVRAV